MKVRSKSYSMLTWTDWELFKVTRGSHHQSLELDVSISLLRESKFILDLLKMLLTHTNDI